MTFCVSHQKQPDDDPLTDATDNKLEVNDVIKNDVTTESARNSSSSTTTTANPNLGEHETKFYR